MGVMVAAMHADARSAAGSRSDMPADQSRCPTHASCRAQHRDAMIDAVDISRPDEERTGSRSPQLLVQVLVDGVAGPESQMVVPMSGSNTIKELKMTLAQKSCFTSKHCLFFGDHELMDHQSVSDIVQAVRTTGNEKYLHVFVRTQDVRHGKLSTEQSSMSFGSLQHLAEDPLAARTIDGTAASSSSADQAIVPAKPQSAVIHIVIRKSAHVSWHPTSDGTFELLVRPSETATDVKHKLLPPCSDAASPRILADVNLVHNGLLMEADRPLLEYGLADGDVLELVPWEPIRAAPAPSNPQIIPQVPELSSPTHDLYKSWQLAASGLRAGIAPDLAPSGTGGSYFLRDENRNIVAVFKPIDEEPFMPHNPRGKACTASSDPSLPDSDDWHHASSPPQARSHIGSLASSAGCGTSMRRGIRPGEGAHREIAAYLLDHSHRAGVPATAPVCVTYPDGSAKHGSLQQFVQCDCDCEDMGPSAFSVAEVHKIAVLDLRLANADRNEGNILARREADGEWALTPIDHGYVLPDTWEDMAFAWSNWRQAEVPFDEDTADFIAALDPEADVAMLRARGVPLRPECARIFKAATVVLKKVAARGLSPKHAADIVERRTMRKSVMEKMHKVACERAVREEDAARDAELNALMPGCSKHSSNGGSAATTPRASQAGRAALPFGHAVPESDAVYLRHLGSLLDEYLEDIDLI